MTRGSWWKIPGVLSGRLAVVLLAALLLPGSALANQCAYSDGKNDNGPCVEVRNELNGWGSQTMNLWCHNGPTARGHKIILRDWGRPDSFTCRGIRSAYGASTSVTIQRTQVGCDTCPKTYYCSGKIVLKLISSNGIEQIEASGCTQP